MSLPYFGNANGEVNLTYTSRLAASDILKFHPELQSKIDEISAKKWVCIFAVTSGTALARLSLDGSGFKIIPSSFFEGGVSGKRETLLQVRIWPNATELIGVPEVKEFRINICSKSFPRAVTADLEEETVTYVHDALWKWQEGDEKEEAKVNEAREVYEIASWLIDVKKYKMDPAIDLKKYEELSEIFKEDKL